MTDYCLHAQSSPRMENCQLRQYYSIFFFPIISLNLNLHHFVGADKMVQIGSQEKTKPIQLLPEEKKIAEKEKINLN
jgi:hypothetical protein